MGGVVPTKLPLDAVLARIEPTVDLRGRTWDTGRKKATLVERSGVGRRQIDRWAVSGVPYWAADRLAIALGVHPVDIWPDWYQLEPVPRPA